MNLNSASYAPVEIVWAYAPSGLAKPTGAKVADFCTSIDFCTARLNSGTTGTAGQARDWHPADCWASQRVSTDASTLSSRLSTLDSHRSKMGFVKNVTNWSVKTQVRNSRAMCEIDSKTSGFFDFVAKQKSGFCPLQSCLPFRGQNDQNSPGELARSRGC